MNGRIKHQALLTVLMLVVSATSPISHVSADPDIPVTVTMTRLVEIDDPDWWPSVSEDYYAKVVINASLVQQSPVVSLDPPFGTGVLVGYPIAFEPFWTLTHEVDGALEMVSIQIELWDEDFGSAD
jgi:hypothetical protein